jgi:hypothetical protein
MTYNFNLNPRYLDGQIYRVYSRRLPNLQYIGSTILNLPARLRGHRYNCTSGIMFKMFQKYDDMVIELVEDYPCFNKDQLCHREQYHIDQYKTQHGVVLNVQASYCSSRGIPFIPQIFVEWYLEQHPEHSNEVQFILLRDYD